MEEELVQEDRDLQLRLGKGEWMINDEEEELIVKEETMEENEIKVEVTEDQLDYLQDYSLAHESAHEEDAIPVAGKSENAQNEATNGTSVVKATNFRKQFSCDKCYTKCSTEKSLAQHKTQAHRSKCDKCCETFENQNQLKTHQLLAHFPILQFNCDTCNSKWRTLNALDKHKLLKRTNKFYESDEEVHVEKRTDKTHGTRTETVTKSAIGNSLETFN